MVLCAVQIHWTCSKVPWQISGDLFRFQISRTKENVHVSGGFGAREAILGSHVSCRFQDGDTGTNNQYPVREASRTGNGLGDSAVRAPTSVVGAPFEPGARSVSFSSGTVDEPRGSQLYQHDPALRHQLRSSRNPENAGKNSRHGITVAVGGPRSRGQDGQATTPAAHVQTREHFGTDLKRKRTTKKKREQKHRGSTLGHKNTDTENKQLQLKLGERRNVKAKTQIELEWSK